MSQNLSPVVRKIDHGPAVAATADVTDVAEARRKDFFIKAEQESQAQVDAIGDLLSLVCENALQAGPIWRPKVVVGQQPGMSVLQALAPGWYWYDSRAIDPFVGPFQSRIQAALEAIDKSGIDINVFTSLVDVEEVNLVTSLLQNYRKLIKHHARNEEMSISPITYGDISKSFTEVGYQMKHFDGTEVHGIRFLDPSPNDPDGVCVDGECDMTRAHFFGVFFHVKSGGTVSCGDFVTYAEAHLYALQLDRRYRFAP
jgi:hypothetical protein